MSTLRVGPVRRDGARITKSAPWRAPARWGGSSTGLPANAPLCGPAARIPGGYRVWIGAGALVSAAGTIINLESGAWLDPFASLMHGGILAPLGMVILAIGLGKKMIARRAVWLHMRALGPDYREYACALENLLRNPGAHSTVDHLVARTEWTESEVVHTLAILCDRGRLQEELDLDTGKYCYRLRDLLP